MKINFLVLIDSSMCVEYKGESFMMVTRSFRSTVSENRPFYFTLRCTSLNNLYCPYNYILHAINM